MIRRSNLRSHNWSNAHQKGIPWKHTGLQHLKRSYVDKVTFVATFVRHPLQYYESVWKFTKQRLHKLADTTTLRDYQSHFHGHLYAAVSRHWHPVFSRWLERMIEYEGSWVTRLFEYYVGPPAGEYCDFIGRQETLADDVRTLLNTVGCHHSVKRAFRRFSGSKINESTAYECNWTTDLKVAISALEKPIIDRFYGDNSDARFYKTLSHHNSQKTY